MYLQFTLSLKRTGGSSSQKPAGKPRKEKRGFPKAGKSRGKSKGNHRMVVKESQAYELCNRPRKKSKSEQLKSSRRDFFNMKLIEWLTGR